MTAIRFRMPNTLIVEAGAARRIGASAGARLGHRILMVTDATLVRLGLVAPIVEELKGAGHEVVLFDDVEPEPSAATVLRAAEAGRQRAPAAGRSAPLLQQIVAVSSIPTTETASRTSVFFSIFGSGTSLSSICLKPVSTTAFIKSLSILKLVKR